MLSFLEWRPDFKLTPSWSTALFVSLFHLISLMAVIWTMISYRPLFVLTLCFVIVGVLSWLASLTSLGFFHKKRQICEVSQEPTGEWRLHSADGSTRLYVLSGASVVSRFAIFLSFRPVGVGRLLSPLLTRSLLIASDSVDAQTYRRLHVWLRWQRGELLGLADFVDNKTGKDNHC